jgi:ribosomal-protein-alanine N-acetyltransferase
MKLPSINVNKKMQISLRNIKRTDVPDIFEYSSNIQVTKYLTFSPHKNIQEVFKSFDNFFTPLIESEKSGAFAVCNSDKLIGVIDFRNQNNGEIIIGYVLAQEFWGRGIMTNVLKIVTMFLLENFPNDKIIVGHHEDNIGSQRVIEKSGYIFFEKRTQILEGSKTSTKWYILSNQKNIR